MHSMMNSSTLMSSMPMLMPGFERNGVERVRPGLEAGERHPRVGEGVDADSEPRDAVAAGDADQAEQQDDADARQREVQNAGRSRAR